ncbi:amino acid racemase [Fulvivirga maritima]|uniref:aspartate/glutamate racemase family protein n=1 Tax=Fulvivirga maritima TaxID=2904247 RepID=UPI001F3565F0|nr:amino acid racemase [Fulvivirga maritima]UII24660.1 amino acid racemase [Fulvivirga maritima]
MIKKTIGVVGGMGPMAGVALVEKITRNTPAHKDQEHFSVILVSNPMIIDRTQFLEGEVDENPAYQISESIAQLAKCGADVVGIACNTSYSSAIYDVLCEELKRRDIKVNVLDLPGETYEELRKHGENVRKVGIMATNGTYKSRVYESILTSNGYEVVLPDVNFQETIIHQIIYNSDYGIKSHPEWVSDEARKKFIQALNFFKIKGADAIILACSELSFPFKEIYPTDLLIIDPMECMARALIREASGKNAEKESLEPSMETT